MQDFTNEQDPFELQDSTERPNLFSSPANWYRTGSYDWDAQKRGALDRPEVEDAMSAGDIFEDVLMGVPRGIEGMVQGIYGLADMASFDMLPDYKDEDRILGVSRHWSGGLTEGLTQFLIPFSAIGLAGKAGKLGKAGKWLARDSLVSEAARSAVVDFAAFEGSDGRLSDLLKDTPYSNIVSEYLKTDMDDGEFEGRLKNMVEGGIIGTPIDAAARMLLGGAKMTKAYKKLRDAGASRSEAAFKASNMIEEEIDSFIDNQINIAAEKDRVAAGLSIDGASDVDTFNIDEMVAGYKSNISKSLAEGGIEARFVDSPGTDTVVMELYRDGTYLGKAVRSLAAKTEATAEEAAKSGSATKRPQLMLKGLKLEGGTKALRKLYAAEKAFAESLDINVRSRIGNETTTAVFKETYPGARKNLSDQTFVWDLAINRPEPLKEITSVDPYRDQLKKLTSETGAARQDVPTSELEGRTSRKQLDRVIYKTTLNNLLADTKIVDMEMTQREKDVIFTLVQAIGERHFDDVNVYFRKKSFGGEADGSYNYATKAVSIYGVALQKGNVGATMMHELFHSLERRLQPKMVQRLKDQFIREQAAHIKANPDARVRFQELRSTDGNVRRRALQNIINNDEYHLISPSEWWAHHATMKASARIDKLMTIKDGGVRALLAQAQLMWSDFSALFAYKFGKNALDYQVSQFMRGRMDAANSSVTRLSMMGDVSSTTAYSYSIPDYAPGFTDTVNELIEAGLSEGKYGKDLDLPYDKSLNALDDNGIPKPHPLIGSGPNSVNLTVVAGAPGGSVLLALARYSATKAGSKARARVEEFLKAAGVDLSDDSVKDAIAKLKEVSASKTNELRDLLVRARSEANKGKTSMDAVREGGDEAAPKPGKEKKKVKGESDAKIFADLDRDIDSDTSTDVLEKAYRKSVVRLQSSGADAAEASLKKAAKEYGLSPDDIKAVADRVREFKEALASSGIKKNKAQTEAQVLADKTQFSLSGESISFTAKDIQLVTSKLKSAPPQKLKSADKVTSTTRKREDPLVRAQKRADAALQKAKEATQNVQAGTMTQADADKLTLEARNQQRALEELKSQTSTETEVVEGEINYDLIDAHSDNISMAVAALVDGDVDMVKALISDYGKEYVAAIAAKFEQLVGQTRTTGMGVTSAADGSKASGMAVGERLVGKDVERMIRRELNDGKHYDLVRVLDEMQNGKATTTTPTPAAAVEPTPAAVEPEAAAVEPKPEPGLLDEVTQEPEQLETSTPPPTRSQFPSTASTDPDPDVVTNPAEVRAAESERVARRQVESAAMNMADLWKEMRSEAGVFGVSEKKLTKDFVDQAVDILSEAGYTVTAKQIKTIMKSDAWQSESINDIANELEALLAPSGIDATDTTVRAEQSAASEATPPPQGGDVTVPPEAPAPEAPTPDAGAGGAGATVPPMTGGAGGGGATPPTPPTPPAGATPPPSTPPPPSGPALAPDGRRRRLPEEIGQSNTPLNGDDADDLIYWFEQHPGTVAGINPRNLSADEALQEWLLTRRAALNFSVLGVDRREGSFLRVIERYVIGRDLARRGINSVQEYSLKQMEEDGLRALADASGMTVFEMARHLKGRARDVASLRGELWQARFMMLKLNDEVMTDLTALVRKQAADPSTVSSAEMLTAAIKIAALGDLVGAVKSVGSEAGRLLHSLRADISRDLMPEYRPTLGSPDAPPAGTAQGAGLGAGVSGTGGATAGTPSAPISQVSDELQQATAQIQQLNTEIADANTRLAAAVASNSAEVANLQSQLDALRLRNTRLQAVRAGLQRRLDALTPTAAATATPPSAATSTPPAPASTATPPGSPTTPSVTPTATPPASSTAPVPPATAPHGVSTATLDAIRTLQTMYGEARLEDMLNRMGGRQAVLLSMERLQQLLDIQVREGGDVTGRVSRIVARASRDFNTLGFWDFHNEWWMNSLVSSSTTWAGVQFLGNALTTMTIPLERMLGGVVTGNARSIRSGMNAYIGMATGLLDGLGVMSRAFTEGRPIGTNMGMERTRQQAFTRDNIPLSNMMSRGAGNLAGPGAQRAAEVSFDFMGGMVRLPMRLILTGDELFKQLNYRGHLRANILDSLDTSGVVGHERSARLQQAMDLAIVNGEFVSNQRLIREGQERARTVLGPHATADELLDYAQNYRDQYWRNSGTVADNFRQAAERARATAVEATLQADPRYDWQRWIMNGVTRMPAMRLFLPFVSTPINALLYAADRNPVTPLMDFVKLGMGNRTANRLDRMGSPAFLGRYFRDQESRFLRELSSQDPTVRADAAGRALFGMSVLGIAWSMAASGNLTGRGPKNPDESKTWRNAGFQPYSFKSPYSNEWISFNRVDPFSSMLGFIADATMAVQYLHADRDGLQLGEEIWASAFYAITNQLTQKSYLQGIKSFVEIFGDESGHKGSEWLKRYGASLVPYQGMRRTMTDLSDEYVRNPSDSEMLDGMMNHVWSSTPGLSEELPPMRDAFGQPVKKAGKLGPDLISPIAVKERTTNDLDRELIALGEAIKPPSYTVQGLDLRNLKSGQGTNAYDRYQELAGTVLINGKTLRQSVEELIRTERYQRMTPIGTDMVDTPRVYAIRAVMAKYRSKAWQSLLNESPNIKQARNEINMMKRDAKMGIAPSILDTQD